MKDKKNTILSLEKGNLPKKDKKEVYDWEQQSKHTLEPWHLSTLTLLGDVLVLLMYMFLNIGVAYQLPIGVVFILLGFIFIIGSYYLLHTKNWPIHVVRYTKLINIVSLCIHIVLTGLTLLLLL